MLFRIATSAVLFAALTVASVACNDGQPPPAQPSAPLATLEPTSAAFPDLPADPHVSCCDRFCSDTGTHSNTGCRLNADRVHHTRADRDIVSVLRARPDSRQYLSIHARLGFRERAGCNAGSDTHTRSSPDCALLEACSDLRTHADTHSNLRTYTDARFDLRPHPNSVTHARAIDYDADS